MRHCAISISFVLTFHFDGFDLLDSIHRCTLPCDFMVISYYDSMVYGVKFLKKTVDSDMLALDYMNMIFTISKLDSIAEHVNIGPSVRVSLLQS